MLAGCHSTPAKAPSAPAPVVAPTSTSSTQPSPSRAQSPAGAAAPAANGISSGAAATGGTPAGSAAAEPIAVPARAAQEYSQALQLMKSGRNTDAELEFKQLAVAYPQFAGPHLNLGLLYLRDSRLAEAEKSFKVALELAPSNPVAGDQLGIGNGAFTNLA